MTLDVIESPVWPGYDIGIHGRTVLATFGTILKTWRQRRRMSQMALALESNVSTRHVSFLETGKSAPSRDMVLRLAETLSVPGHVRNEWLLAAGFAPAFRQRALDEEELRPFRRAVTRLLDGHDPYPGWALDGGWRIVQANGAGESLLRHLGIEPGDSLVAAIVDDPTLGGALVNWEETVSHLAARLGAEARRRGDPDTAAAASRLKRTAGHAAHTAPVPAAFPTQILYREQVVSLVSVQALFNTAADLTLADLRIELFFPLDKASETVFEGGALSP